MSDAPKYAFKGVWIPREIWESKEITWMEKCLLADIDALDDETEKGCFASNGYFAEKFSSSEASIANQISKLRKLGLVTTIGFDGRERRLRLTCRLIEPKPKDEGRVNHAVKAPIGESKGEGNPPTPADAGDVKIESSRKTKMLPTSPEAIRISKLFGRRLTTPWQKDEVKTFKELQPMEIDDLALLETYYAFERQKGGNGMHRRDLKTFLNNYLSELDRARAWRQNAKAHERTKVPSTNGVAKDAAAGTANEGRSSQYAGVGRISSI